MTYLDTYTYSCSEGYTTTDDICTVCESDGTLSGPSPNCTGNINSLKNKNDLHLTIQH